MNEKNKNDWVKKIKPAIYFTDDDSEDIESRYYMADKVNPEYIQKITEGSYKEALELREEEIKRNPNRKVLKNQEDSAIDVYAKFAAKRLVGSYQEELLEESNLLKMNLLKKRIENLEKEYNL